MVNHLLIKALKKRQSELKREDTQYCKILASGIYDNGTTEQSIRDNRDYCIASKLISF